MKNSIKTALITLSIVFFSLGAFNISMAAPVHSTGYYVHEKVWEKGHYHNGKWVKGHYVHKKKWVHHNKHYDKHHNTHHNKHYDKHHNKPINNKHHKNKHH